MSVLSTVVDSEVSLILVGWPIAFLWLMKQTIKANGAREDKLIRVNEGWQSSFDKLSDAIGNLNKTLQCGVSITNKEDVHSEKDT